jgi:DNA-binding LytR/AlgR family response regulator
MNATALIAEDEPILAQALSTMLLRLWPELTILPLAQDGGQAVEVALSSLPDVMFLDIQMPDRDGLDAAQAIVEGWPDGKPLPLVVFVTAYDEYAVAAFERAAVDYVLKPVQTPRLAVTCDRLKQLLRQRSPQQEDGMLDALRSLSGTVGQTHQADEVAPADTDDACGPASHSPLPPLRVLQAAVGSGLQLVQVEDVQYFEAADKYVRIVTGHPGTQAADLLIRTPLRELIPRLDADLFWQIHRSIVVNVKCIDRVSREYGRLRVHVKGRPDTLEVSRMYSHLFKAM